MHVLGTWQRKKAARESSERGTKTYPLPQTGTAEQALYYVFIKVIKVTLEKKGVDVPGVVKTIGLVSSYRHGPWRAGKTQDFLVNAATRCFPLMP